jgi:GntR family transcriptional regulator / MocR family aminotransferase
MFGICRWKIGATCSLPDGVSAAAAPIASTLMADRPSVRRFFIVLISSAVEMRRAQATGQHRDASKIVYHADMDDSLGITIDRSARTALSAQISDGIEKAIARGALPLGARLPSWLDLAAQLGVARGTVRAAYERLAAAQLVVASPALGTRVADQPSLLKPPPEPSASSSFMAAYGAMTAGPAIFQMGVPATGILPVKTLSRLRAAAVRAELSDAQLYPDPRGEPVLRREISAHLALARGLHCGPSQVFITSGFSGGLGLVLRALRREGERAWVEDPGFLFARHGLALGGLTPVSVPVDAEGIDVGSGISLARDAAIAMVTPGQQAPTGVTLSRHRRTQLLDWAAEAGAWIIEDDYLGELQLDRRAAPALASVDANGRVIHLGSFSKTISPATRIGFVVAPPALVARVSEVAATLAPAPAPSMQVALAAFMREGHYLRHLRRAKRAYAARRDALLTALGDRGLVGTTAGLSVRLSLPVDLDDQEIVRQAYAFGLAPAALSACYAEPAAGSRGLLLGIATAPDQHLDRACERLADIIASAEMATGRCRGAHSSPIAGEFRAGAIR